MWIMLCQEDDPDPLYRTMIPFDNWLPILSTSSSPDEGGRVRRYNSPQPTPRTSTSVPTPASSRRSSGRSSATSSAEPRSRHASASTSAESAWCAGGLTHILHRRLVAALGPYAGRLVSAEKAGVLWASTLTPFGGRALRRVTGDRPLDDRRVPTARTITPGVTTTDDLVWHYWQTSRDLGLDVAFALFPHPPRPRSCRRTTWCARATSSIATPASSTSGSTPTTSTWPTCRAAARPTRPPASRRGSPTTFACRTSTSPNFVTAGPATPCCTTCSPSRPPGHPGPKIYSHNLGLFLHQPGPLIGLPWDSRTPAPAARYARIRQRLRHGARHRGPGAGMGNPPLRLGTEEPVLFDRDGCSTLCPRQTEFHLI